MKLTIHRGSKEIGGTCIELQLATSRILIGFGLPLVDENKEIRLKFVFMFNQVIVGERILKSILICL